MVKILSQAGISLADMYQVEGSIAGIEDLDTRELAIFHEVGATVFSERFRTTIREVDTGAIAQSTEFNLSINNLPASIVRILGIVAVADTASRLENCQVSVHDAVLDPIAQDFPIWAWGGTSQNIRLSIGGTVVQRNMLIPVPESVLTPTFGGGEDQGATPVKDLRFRGDTTAFGAGTVLVNFFVYLAFSFTGGVSSFGARVPSW